MQITFDGTRARTAIASAITTFLAIIGWAVDETKSLVNWLVRHLSASVVRARSSVHVDGDRLAGNLHQAWVGALWNRLYVGLIGRESAISMLFVVVSPVLAYLANYWTVGVGYLTLVDWVQGTWYGTDPEMTVFVGVTILLAIGTLSAWLNAGLVPTSIIVMAPVFGLAFGSYGTELAAYGVVSLPQAVEFGIILSTAFGVPIAIAGFAIGCVGHQIAETWRDRGWPSNSDA